MKGRYSVEEIIKNIETSRIQMDAQFALLNNILLEAQAPYQVISQPDSISNLPDANRPSNHYEASFAIQGQEAQEVFANIQTVTTSSTNQNPRKRQAVDTEASAIVEMPVGRQRKKKIVASETVREHKWDDVGLIQGFSLGAEEQTSIYLHLVTEKSNITKSNERISSNNLPQNVGDELIRLRKLFTHRQNSEIFPQSYKGLGIELSNLDLFKNFISVIRSRNTSLLREFCYMNTQIKSIIFALDLNNKLKLTGILLNHKGMNEIPEYIQDIILSITTLKDLQHFIDSAVQSNKPLSQNVVDKIEGLRAKMAPIANQMSVNNNNTVNVTTTSFGFFDEDTNPVENVGFLKPSDKSNSLF